MKYNTEDIISFDDKGTMKEGVVIDLRGDNYIVYCDFTEIVVHEDNVMGIKSDEDVLKFKDGGEAMVSLNKGANLVNNMSFYRYYPLNSEPFKKSFDINNKYGSGIYFLDNTDFYSDKFDNARLITIKPKVKHPLILTYHKRNSPSFEYVELLNKLKESSGIVDKNDLSSRLLNSGFDSLVIYEPRGIYFVLLKEDENLIEVISDLGVGVTESLANGGNLKTEELDSDVMIEISHVVLNNYKDIHPYQGEILFRNFNDDLEGFFIPSKSDVEYVTDLSQKGYLQRDYEVVGDAFVLTQKGKDLVEDVVGSTY